MRPRIILIPSRRFVQLIAVLALGLILGSSLTTVLIAHRIDELSLANQKLQVSLEATQEELNQAQKNLETQQSPTVTSIESRITLLENSVPNLTMEVVRLALEDHVRDMLKPLKGREISTLDPLSISQIVNHRIVEAEGNSFTLRVTLLVISPKLKIYVSAIPDRASHPKPDAF